VAIITGDSEKEVKEVIDTVFDGVAG